LLLVFHGLDRNADQYRDHAHSLGDRLCAIIVAPLFSKEGFPTWRYQRGGIVSHGVVQPEKDWTGQYVLDLVAWLRRQDGALPYALIGHSAGGQFLSRVAAFTPTDARRIVIANPSTYVLPSLDAPAPYGMGGVYPANKAEEELRRYLRAPVTIFLGAADQGDANRDDSREAMQQGVTRYERGLNTFHAARAMAQTKGWTFGWRLVEVPGVGHSATKMFASPQALDALAL
jgi:pimeloyl-ACP methyl ester carboxylesterase